jgi:hypothetical protein
MKLLIVEDNAGVRCVIRSLLASVAGKMLRVRRRGTRRIPTLNKGEYVKVNVRIFVVLALFTLALSSPALSPRYESSVRAITPFNFYAGGALLPAGTYTFAIDLSTPSIKMSSGYKNSRFLVGTLQDGANKSDVFILTFRTDGAGVYVLQKAEWTDYGVAFNIKREVVRSADARSLNATQTVIAQLR